MVGEEGLFDPPPYSVDFMHNDWIILFEENMSHSQDM